MFWDKDKQNTLGGRFTDKSSESRSDYNIILSVVTAYE